MLRDVDSYFSCPVRSGCIAGPMIAAKNKKRALCELIQSQCFSQCDYGGMVTASPRHHEVFGLLGWQAQQRCAHALLLQLFHTITGLNRWLQPVLPCDDASTAAPHMLTWSRNQTATLVTRAIQLPSEARAWFDVGDAKLGRAFFSFASVKGQHAGY